MKKSTLFVLLLAAVLLFMTACNPATKEPAATDDPTSIPGVKEDTNVPAKPESAEESDILNIFNALFSLTQVAPSDYDAYGSMSESYKAENGTIDGHYGNSLTIDADCSVSSSKTQGSNSFVLKVDGTLKVDEKNYEFLNFSVTNKMIEGEETSSKSYSGTCKLNNKPLENDADKEDAVDYVNMLYGSQYTVSSEFDTTNNLSYDSKDVVVGTVDIRSSGTLDKNTTVVIANLKFGEKLVPMTAKYIVSSTKGNSSIEIKYASFNGVYYTEESLLKSNDLMKTLMGFASIH